MQLTLEKNINKLFLVYTPIRAYKNICYDGINNIQAEICGSAGFVNKNPS